MANAGLAAGTGTAQQPAPPGAASPALELYGFGSFSDVPVGAIVSSAAVAVAEHQSAAGHPCLFQLWDYSGTPVQIGTTQKGTASTGSANVSNAAFAGVTQPMLATLRVRVYGTLPSGGTESVDGVTVIVTYTFAGGLAGLAHGTGTAQPAPMIGVATGTGTVLAAAAAVAVSATAGLATAAGTAWPLNFSYGLARTATGAGTALQPAFDEVNPGTAAGTGTAQQPAVTGTVSPGLELYGFSFSDVPYGSTVNSVTVAVTEHQSAGGHACLFELWDYSGAPAIIGTTQTGTASTSTANISSAVFTGVTYAMLATLRVRVYGTLPSAGGTESVDSVSLTAGYTPGPGTSVTAGLATGTAVALGVSFGGSPVTVNAGLAAATGAALGIVFLGSPVIQDESSASVLDESGVEILAEAGGFVTVGIAQGAGTALAPGATAAAGLAAGTGSAQQPLHATGVAAGLATGTAATALAVTASPAVAPAAGLVTGTGTARTAVPAGGALPGVATGTAAAALIAGPAAGVTAGLAQGTGTAQPVAMVIAPAGFATGDGTAQQPLITVFTSGNALAGLAQGAGAALDAPMVIAAAGLATAVGTAQAAPLANASAGLVTGTGAAALMAAPAVSTTAGLAAGTGTAQPAPLANANAGLAHGTGTAQPAPLANASAGPATGTGTAQPVSAGILSSPVLTASGFGIFPQVPAGAVILSVVASVWQYGSTAGIGVPVYQLWDGVTAQIGTAQYGSASLTPGHVDTVVFTGVAYTQLATLQLRVYGSAQTGNHGAIMYVDAVSLAVSWAPNKDTAALPGVLTAIPVIRTPAASGAVHAAVTPGQLACVPAVPAPAPGFETATVFPGRLVTGAVIPRAAAAAGAYAAPGTLAVIPGLPAITDVTGPAWATADSGGGWGNPGNITGSPDGSYATWTVP